MIATREISLLMILESLRVPYFVPRPIACTQLSSTLIYLSRLMAVTRGLMQFSGKRSHKVEASMLSSPLGYAIDQTFFLVSTLMKFVLLTLKENFKYIVKFSIYK